MILAKTVYKLGPGLAEAMREFEHICTVALGPTDTTGSVEIVVEIDGGKITASKPDGTPLQVTIPSRTKTA